MKLPYAIAGTILSALTLAFALGYFVVFLVFLLGAWLIMGLHAQAQERLNIARAVGTNTGKAIVRATWQDDNKTALVTAANITGPWKPFLYRVDTNAFARKVTVEKEAEHRVEVLKLAPKFTGAIPEGKK
ncbi:MAG TPA: hypothetical protein VM656_09580 [Pyrinomonadaceae bacterium]|jgi:Na+-transporting methylmalonyl-CoA/oxaloacetate decarboxylase gamma subunit|nr:hypothetical protein [Pyrinomonadaceae bacterium]